MWRTLSNSFKGNRILISFYQNVWDLHQDT
jgi:hypothetical protein